MSCRPRLKSHVQPLRRGDGSLQLGICPDAGVVLDGLSEAEVAVVEGLDGSLDITALYAVATAAGVDPDRLSDLIAVLREHHLLVDSTADRAALSSIEEPRRDLLRPEASAVAAAYHLAGDGLDHVVARSAQHVVIGGEGDLPSALADLLRVGGIGRVSLGRNAVNVLDLELRSPPSRPTRSRPSLPGSGWGETSAIASMSNPADLVVLVATGAIRPDAGEPWLRRGIPHLPSVVQGHRVQVGPLIAGGDGPCLTCLDLHRRDRDDAWPALLSQSLLEDRCCPTHQSAWRAR
jgi:hypothetical protein